jgi:ABC-type polysaccharide/polyol phosphate export permease
VAAGLFAISIAISLVILVLGIVVFRRLEPRILKEA